MKSVPDGQKRLVYDAYQKIADKMARRMRQARRQQDLHIQPDQRSVPSLVRTAALKGIAAAGGNR